MQDQWTNQHKPRARQQAQKLPQMAWLMGLAAAATLNSPCRAADPLQPSKPQPLSPGLSQQGVQIRDTRPSDPQSSSPQTSTTSAAPDAVTSVKAVDLERYVGLWYEIARIPAWFQSGCVGQTTARYQRRQDNRIDVVNQCLNRNGKVNTARGLARVIDRSTNARLQVSFVSFLGWRPFWGDYWVLALDPDYRWAVIGDPRRRYGWILSRSPQMDAATLALCFEALQRNGYKRSTFAFTPQSPPVKEVSTPRSTLMEKSI